MSIGTLRCIVVNVTDFEVGYPCSTRNTRRSRPPVPSHQHANCMHIDITPTNGIDAAIEQIPMPGGTVNKRPNLNPRPGSQGNDKPAIDWAVMQDPFGNEFCLVHDLTRSPSAAAMAAAERGVKDDRALRETAGQTGAQAVAAAPP